MNIELKDKVILISTGTKGVGAALVEACAVAGATVVFCGRDEVAAQRICENLSFKGLSAQFIKVDLESIEDIDNMFEFIERKYNRLNGYVSYAGITPVAFLEDTSPEVFDKVINTNVRAPFFSAGKAVSIMQRGVGGSMVFVGSAHSWGGQKDRAAYAVSKGALFTLAEHLAHNYSQQHIRSNYLTMGWTLTEGEIALRSSQGMTLAELEEWGSEVIPMGRMCTVGDAVPAILYLLSDLSSMVTGSNIRCTGGEYI